MAILKVDLDKARAKKKHQPVACACRLCLRSCLRLCLHLRPAVPSGPSKHKIVMQSPARGLRDHRPTEGLSCGATVQEQEHLELRIA